MDEAVALLRSTQIKKRLAGVTALLEVLHAQIENDADALVALLPDVLPCLRENNFKVAMTSLEILALLLERVPDATVRLHLKAIWNGIVECLGDSKLQVREKAVDVVVALTQILGVTTMFDRLRPCVAHKNWRTREQTVHALWRCLEHMRLFNAPVKDEVLDDIVRLLEDSSKEVRDAAMAALEKFYENMRPSLMYALENKKIRSSHMKTLTEKFSGQVQAQPPAAEPRSYPGTVKTQPRPSSQAPLSSTARFLSAIRNKEYDFDNLNSAVEALSRPAASGASSPSRSSTASNKSQSASVADASLAEAAEIGTADARGGSSVSDKDVQRELAKIGDGLRLDNDWSIRVDSLKSLQRLTHKCNLGGSAALSTLALGIRSVREGLNEQVCDLRSSVAREACQTLQTLAKVLKDDFNPHAEYFMGNLMKATYVTILVISTSSDTSIRGIIESTKTGYNRIINKLIEGAKTRNQVLRVNCVNYLTLTLEVWSVQFLSKHLDLFVQIIPALLHDALAEVRAQARKCYWAMHRIFPQEADALFDRLDATTQKNVRDDSAAREKGSSSVIREQPSSFSSSGRFTLRKELSARSMGGSTADSIVAENESSAKVVATSSAGSSVPLGPRRVLGSAPLSGDSTDSISFSRVLGQNGGARRIGLTSRSQSTDDDSSSNATSRPMAGPLRVLKTVDSSASTQAPLPPALRAQRVQIVTDSLVTAPSAGTEPSNGPVPWKDRPDGPKRRAVTPESGEKERSPSALSRPTSTLDDQSGPKSSGSTARDLQQQLGSAPRSRVTASAQPTQSTSSEEGFEDALARIENGLWSVRLEAVELIDRTLEKADPSTGSAKEKKMDERVLLALVRHLGDAHYRVAQAALKALQSCIRAMPQQQVAPYLKSLLPRLFQKLVDPKESTRSVAKEILEYVVATYDGPLLVGYIIQQLAEGSNVKMKTAVCKYLKQLLPRSREYFQQSSNNAHMRSLLTKLVQLMKADSPVSLTSACGDVLQVACASFALEVDISLPLLAPSKRGTLSRVLRERGIVLSLSHGSTTDQQRTVGRTENQSAPPPPPPPAEAPTSRKRHAPSPSRFASSPVVTEKKELAIDQQTPRPTAALDYAKLSSLSNFASKLTSASSPVQANLDELLAIVADNNAAEATKVTAFHKMGTFIKQNESDTFWDLYFPRLLSVLLEGASERDVNAIRVLQRVVGAQPRRAEEFFHPILVALLDSINGRVDLAAHLAELTLTDVVRGAARCDRVLDLLIPLVETREPPSLQVVLHLVRAVLEGVTSTAASNLQRSTEWNSRLLALLVAKLQHTSSDVRKRAVDGLVAYYFATNEDSQLSSYLAKHVDGTKQKLVDIFIQRKKADRERGAPMDVTA